jgi:hypothetical protein
MVGWRVWLCLCVAIGATPAAAAQPYVIDGLTLGGNFTSERDYRCAPSGQFAGFNWCQRKRHEGSARSGFSASNALLYRSDGALAYISREIVPAFFAAGDIQAEIKRLTARFGERAQVLRLPRREGLPSAVLALWGQIELELVEETDAAALARDPRQVLLIDYLGDVRRSVELAQPVFRLGGGAGFLWTATHDEQGRGTLRFLALDASVLTASALPQEAPKPQITAPARAGKPRVAALAPAETVETTQAIAVRGDPLTERAPQTAPSESAIERRAQVERHEVERQATPLFDGPLILVVALLALVAVGIVMTRRSVVQPQSALRRDVGFEIPAADGGGEAPSAWRACASAACFTAVAVMVYLGSQSPASVRGVLGYFGLSDSAR